MPEDVKDVPEEQVSEEKNASKETETKAEEKTEEKAEEKSQEQPLTEERVQQLVAEATAKAVTEAKEAGRRELQSQQTRNVNAERRARLAESKVTGLEAGLSGIDEETRKDIELARLREQDKHYQSTAQEEEQRHQQEAYFQQMNNSLTEEVKTWGIDPTDKGIDYASDAPDYFTGRKRFTDSLQKIVNAKQVRADGEQVEKFSNMEKKLRKELGLDSVDTTAGGGGGSDSDAEFKKEFGAGNLPSNKTNYERAKKLGLA